MGLMSVLMAEQFLRVIFGQDALRHAVDERTARRKVGRGLLEQSDKTAETDVAIGKEHGILGTVEAAREAQSVVRCIFAQALRPAQDVVSERMSAEYGVLKLVINQFGRRVVVTFNLVAYHLNLLVNLCLRIRAVEHHVGKQVDSPCDVLLQQCRIEHRVLLVGEGVEVASHLLQPVQYLY